MRMLKAFGVVARVFLMVASGLLRHCYVVAVVFGGLLIQALSSRPSLCLIESLKGFFPLFYHPPGENRTYNQKLHDLMF